MREVQRTSGGGEVRGVAFCLSSSEGKEEERKAEGVMLTVGWRRAGVHGITGVNKNIPHRIDTC